ncbi:ABC transporter permease [Mesorhizobium sp.]|uniref:ABC transporter permease n=1 Tax=Mesorhizobium sp. TaxID=1871066 RepID=UPI00257C9597|nr:ABC transporter permease [Mesorhizobium sp.]
MPLLVALAFVVVGVVVLCAVLAPWIAPYDPSLQRLDVGVSLPSSDLILGTDTLGRDILSRTIHGASTALVGPMVIAAGAFAIATILGLLAGYLGGWIDTLIMRWVDFMHGLPSTLIVIVVVGVIGGGYWVAVAVLLIAFVPSDTRIVRSAVLEQRPRPYIEAARSLGISKPRILLVHIIPNILPIIVAYIAIDFAFALVNLAGLSFLGLGVEPGTADWGRMLSENRNLLLGGNPLGTLVPASAMILTAISMNLIGDWLFEEFIG